MTEQELAAAHLEQLYHETGDALAHGDWGKPVNLLKDMTMIADKQLLDMRPAANGARYGKR